MTRKHDAVHWPDVIMKLKADRGEAEAAALAAAHEAGAVALPASMGDRAAAARLAEADAREAAAVRRGRQLDMALADAEVQLRAVEQEAADALTAERRTALREAAREMVNRAAAVDEAARILARAMGDYDAHLLTMSRMGLDATQLRRLSNRTMIAGGLHLAGLTGKVPLASCSPHHRKTLRDWSAQMLGDLVEAPARPAGAPREPALVEAAA